MASSFSIKIDNLRKKSRVLLTCLEENAKVVRKEVKKLRLKNSSSLTYINKPKFVYERNSDVWKLRNDSSGVGAALSPDYFRFSPKYESSSAPDMNAQHRRLLIKTDKKYPKSSPPRRAIKECYCYTSLPDTRKINQRSGRTKHRTNVPSFRECRSSNCGDGGDVSVPGSGRMNNSDVWKMRENDETNNEEPVYSPPLSTATLRRAQKIDYTPRSKFLRKVQSKINTLRSSSTGSQIRSTPRSPSPLPARFNYHSKDVECKIAPLGKKIQNINEEVITRKEFPRKHNCLELVDEKETIDTQYKIPKKTLLPKKTITSIKSTNEQQKYRDLKSKKYHESKGYGSRPTLRSPPPSKKIVKTIIKDNYASRAKIEDRNLKHSLLGDYEKICSCSEYRQGKFSGEILDDEPLDFEINDVRKFREKNYFDTHASNPCLLGSRSSGSIQQFRLNERLFPEPIGKIHRENLVVSIPPCATRQKRGIHYFPRSIVRQEKNTWDNNYPKKRRCPSCPLIGHTVDLGALKVSHPTNSLALRYQKGIP